eukprot:6179053-Pleurochrysis_carterae.AAC.3
MFASQLKSERLRSRLVEFTGALHPGKQHYELRCRMIRKARYEQLVDNVHPNAENETWSPPSGAVNVCAAFSLRACNSAGHVPMRVCVH